MSAPERGGAEARFQAARLGELRARSRWYATLNEVQDRTSLAALSALARDELRETVGEIAEGALRRVRERPKTIAAIAGGVLLFALRKPLLRGARALFSRRRATREPDREFESQPPIETITEEIRR